MNDLIKGIISLMAAVLLAVFMFVPFTGKDIVKLRDTLYVVEYKATAFEDLVRPEVPYEFISKVSDIKQIYEQMDYEKVTVKKLSSPSEDESPFLGDDIIAKFNEVNASW